MRNDVIIEYQDGLIEKLEARIKELEAAIREHYEHWFEGMDLEEANKQLYEVLNDE